MKRNIFSAIAVATLLLTACSEIDNPPQPNTGTSIGFNIDLAQDWKAEKESTRKKMRRQPIHAIPMQMSDGGQLWLKAITTNGIKTANESIKTADGDGTRGTPIESREQLGNFSSFCYYSSSNSIHFSNMKSTADGTLADKRIWPVGQQLKFFAVHPYDGNGDNFGGNGSTGISYNFKLNPNVKRQVDLMYASTGDLDYNIDEKAPLHFNHALTAVNFVMGDGFTFFGALKEIKLKNVYTSGTFTLPTGATTKEGTTATGTWSNWGGQDVVVSDHEFDITTGPEHHGQTITTGDNVFLMIPQALDDVEIEITLDVSGELITVSGSLKDSPAWEPGTTRTYVINSQKDISEYIFSVSADSEVNFDAGNMNIEVNSFFLNPDGTTREVEWEVESTTYSGGGGSTDWIDFPTSGIGSATVTAPLSSSLNNKKALRDNALRNATPRGTAGDPWDLSIHDFHGNVTPMNTANCYIISAPGHYKLPLVYGNACQNGTFTDAGYHTTNTVTGANDIEVLQRFLDYKNKEIYNPWIKDNTSAQSNPTRYVPMTASLVWSDINENILTNPTVDADKEYLIFEVKQENLTEHGNAVVAVKDADGFTMWSWHLWFTTPDAMDKVTITTRSTSTSHPLYRDITKENLGCKYEKWFESDFEGERQVTITIRQKEAKEGDEEKTATFTVKQKAGKEMKQTATYYQSGRKDAFPGFTTLSGKYYPNNSIRILSNQNGYGYDDAIKNPGTIYMPNYTSYNVGNDWCSTPYYNTWAVNQTSSNYEDVYLIDPNHLHTKFGKTIYDPCPVGFQIPNFCTFLAFMTGNGMPAGNSKPGTVDENYKFHAVPKWDNGWHVYTNAEETETVYFPALGIIISGNSGISFRESYGHYWTSHRPRYAVGYYFAEFCQAGFSCSKLVKNEVVFCRCVRPMAHEE